MIPDQQAERQAALEAEIETPPFDAVKVTQGFTLEDVRFENSRRVLVAEFHVLEENGGSDTVAVRLESRSEDGSHPFLRELLGGRLRVRIEQA